MKWKARYIPGVLPAIVGVMLSSCVYDDGPSAEDAEVDITFRMVMQQSRGISESRSANSRGTVPPDKITPAVWGDKYDEAGSLEFEEKILRDGFTVALFKDDAYVGHLSPVYCNERVTAADGSEIYYMHGTLVTEIPEEELATEIYKVMVVANTPGISTGDVEQGTGVQSAGIGNVTYRFHGKENIGKFAAIPMWGVTTTGLRGIVPGKRYDIGTVDMLRAMAKIQVRLKSNVDQSNVSIHKIEVIDFNRNGYVVPGDWNTVPETGAVSMANTCRVPQSVAGSADSDEFLSDDGRSVTFYLPEYENPDVPAGTDVADGEIHMRVYYTVMDTDGTENHYNGIIRFCEYDDKGALPGKRLWNVVRNHFYSYTMSVTGKTYPDLRFEVKIENMENGGNYDYEYDE